MECPNKGCKAMTPRHKLENHRNTVCVGREIPCETCGEMVTLVELDRHVTEECRKALVACRNGCGAADLLRSEVSLQYDVVPSSVPASRAMWTEWCSDVCVLPWTVRVWADTCRVC